MTGRVSAPAGAACPSACQPSSPLAPSCSCWPHRVLGGLVGGVRLLLGLGAAQQQCGGWAERHSGIEIEAARLHTFFRTVPTG